MKRWLQRLTIASGTVLILVVGFLMAEHARGRWQLSRYLAGLEARGEVLSVAALEPERPRAEENSALNLMAWSNRLNLLLTNSLRYPHSLRLASPGRAIVTATLTEWSSDGETLDRWADVRADVDRDQDLLIALRMAADLPAYDSGFDYSRGFVDFQLGGTITVKRAVQLLHNATLFELHRGNQETAHRNLCALVKLSLNQKPEPLVIFQLVRQACVAMAFNATWQALQNLGWTEVQLAELQAAWSNCDLPRDMGNAFSMERAMVLDFYRQIKRSPVALKKVIGEREGAAWKDLAGALPTSGFWLHSLHLPIWRMAWIDQDAVRSLKQWDVMIERERLVRTNSWSALSGRPLVVDAADSMPLMEGSDRDQFGWYDRLRYLLSAESFSITDILLRKTLVLQTQQQMALTAIALARYRSAQGQDPLKLEMLVPGQLRELPRDGMNGEPLRYRTDPVVGFVLYSVGVDGTDDGGDPTPANAGGSYRQLWDGRDAVWPAAASLEESEAAMKAIHE